MAYLKPQSPLKNNDDYIYPLTTADQVIMEDGSRLNQLATPKAGFIYPLASDIVPEGFLLCDGAEYLRDEYPELFTAIGTIYGAGDGSTTFNVPNLQTRVPVGAGDGYELGATDGEEKHLLTTGEMPNHSHVLNFPFDTNTARPVAVSQQNFCTQTTTTTSGENKLITDSITYTSSSTSQPGYLVITGKTGNNQYHNNMQPYAVVNYIIATGKNTGVSVQDIIVGAQALPLGVEYGGTNATNDIDARKNLGVDNYVVDKVIYGKGKNLLKNIAKSQTINGVTFTVNEDGSITVNGTASAQTTLLLNKYQYEDIVGKVLSGCPDGGGSTTYSLMATYRTDSNAYVTEVHDSSKNTVLPENDSTSHIQIHILIRANVTVSNITFYPMVRLASETDDTYEPYYEGLMEVPNKLSMELLWENSSPTSSFSAKTISVDLTNWEKIVVFAYDTASDCSLVSEYGKKGHTSRMSVARLYTSSSTKYFGISRKFTVYDSGIQFTDSVISNASSAVNDNKTLVPVYIYGVKGVS